MKTDLRIPVLGLVDSDPYGLKILSVYMSGSKNMSYDSSNLTTPDIKWLGVRPSDLNRRAWWACDRTWARQAHAAPCARQVQHS